MYLAVMLALYAAFFITGNGWCSAIAGVLTVASIIRLKVDSYDHNGTKDRDTTG